MHSNRDSSYEARRFPNVRELDLLRQFFKFLQIGTQQVSRCLINYPWCLYQRIHFLRLLSFCMNHWLFSFATDFLATAPLILSWFAEWIVWNLELCFRRFRIDVNRSSSTCLLRDSSIQCTDTSEYRMFTFLRFPPWHRQWYSTFLQVCKCAFHTMFLLLLGRGMTNVRAETFLRNSWPFRKSRNILQNFLCPINVVEHWHEDDSIFKLFCIYVERSDFVSPGKIFHSSSVVSPSIPINSLYTLDC